MGAKQWLIGVSVVAVVALVVGLVVGLVVVPNNQEASNQNTTCDRECCYTINFMML